MVEERADILDEKNGRSRHAGVAIGGRGHRIRYKMVQFFGKKY
jgi:hypothetical protein